MATATTTTSTPSMGQTRRSANNTLIWSIVIGVIAVLAIAYAVTTGVRHDSAPQPTSTVEQTTTTRTMEQTTPAAQPTTGTSSDTANGLAPSNATMGQENSESVNGTTGTSNNTGTSHSNDSAAPTNTEQR